MRCELAFKGWVRFFSRLVNKWETRKSKFPRHSLITGVGGVVVVGGDDDFLNVSSCLHDPFLDQMLPWQDGRTPRKINIQRQNFHSSEVNQISPLCLLYSFLARFPLEAETSKMNASPSRWKSCFYTTVDVYTGDSTWGEKGFLGGWWDLC